MRARDVVLTWLVFLWSSAAQAQSRIITILPDADTTVRSDLYIRSNDNYGRDGTILVGGNREPGNVTDAIRSLIRFNLAGVQAPVQRALLRLDVQNVYSEVPSPVFNITVHEVLGGSPLSGWAEGNGAEDEASPVLNAVHPDPAQGVAWTGVDQGGDSNNSSQPPFNDVAAAAVTLQGAAAGQTVEFDVTTLVNAWIGQLKPNCGLVLKDASLSSFAEIRFAAREIAHYEGPQYRLHPARLVLHPRPGVVEVTPGPSGVTASTHDGNLPGNTVDNYLGSRWSGNGNGAWIKYDLGSVRTVRHVTIGVYQGNVRRNRFELEVSTDGTNWAQVIPNPLHDGLTSGTTTLEQEHDFTDTSARYVRYVGRGTAAGSSWNSVTEVSIFAVP